ncbi:hypothetical protein QJQ45_002808 [Haematococcus lacustris]|nr:hypothetical protein QJQ45_002808 [Haematococcus lacustris]
MSPPGPRRRAGLAQATAIRAKLVSRCRASAVMQHDGCSQSMSNAAAEAEASVQAIQQLWRTALEEQYAAQADVAYAGDFPDSFDLAPDFLNELIAVGSPRSNDSSLLQRTQTWSSLTHPAQQHSQTLGDDGQQRLGAAAALAQHPFELQ